MKTLSIVIPVYNEQERLGKTFKALSELRLPRGLKLEKVIFVNDGSTDGTELRIKNHELRNKSKFNIKIISYNKNMGKGYAVKMGMMNSNADYTLFCDADMSTSLKELSKFLPFFDKGTDIVIGTRKNGESTVVEHQPWYRELMGRGFTLLSNIVLDLKVSDFTCGFKAFSKSAKNQIFSSLYIKRWSFDCESLYLAKKYDLKVAEVPVIWSDDKKSKVKIFTDIPRSLMELFLIRYLYFPRIFRLEKILGRPAYAFVKTVKSLIF